MNKFGLVSLLKEATNKMKFANKVSNIARKTIVGEKTSKICLHIINEIESLDRAEVRYDQYGKLAGPFNPPKKPVALEFFKILKDHANSSKIKSNQISSVNIYKRFENVIASLPQSDAHDLDLNNFIPPPHIHMMGRGRGSMFDIKNCDIIINALDNADKKIQKHKHYLDFGCSSGRTVRTLGAAYPSAFWHGVDPVEESILFARMAFPKHSFYVSNQDPPLQFSDDSLDGVVALSIWSHFSEEKAKVWFKEMHRVINPGGFLLITAHGYTDIAKKAEIQRFDDSEMNSIFHDIKKKGFHFLPNLKDGHRGLDTGDWGTTFFTKEWLSRNLMKSKWDLLYFTPGEWGARQDVYVLTPKKRT